MVDRHGQCRPAQLDEVAQGDQPDGLGHGDRQRVRVDAGHGLLDVSQGLGQVAQGRPLPVDGPADEGARAAGRIEKGGGGAGLQEVVDDRGGQPGRCGLGAGRTAGAGKLLVQAGQGIGGGLLTGIGSQQTGQAHGEGGGRVHGLGPEQPGDEGLVEQAGDAALAEGPAVKHGPGRGEVRDAGGAGDAGPGGQPGQQRQVGVPDERVDRAALGRRGGATLHGPVRLRGAVSQDQGALPGLEGGGAFGARLQPAPHLGQLHRGHVVGVALEPEILQEGVAGGRQAPQAAKEAVQPGRQAGGRRRVTDVHHVEAFQAQLAGNDGGAAGLRRPG